MLANLLTQHKNQQYLILVPCEVERLLSDYKIPGGIFSLACHKFAATSASVFTVFSINIVTDPAHTSCLNLSACSTLD